MRCCCSNCPLLVVALVLLSGFAAAPFVRADLYDDDKKVEKGELADRDYLQARWDIMMLDLAVKQKQPEGRIGLNLVSTIKNLEDLSKKYPKHEEIKKMKEHAEEIEKKINPNAPRSEPWKPGMPWDEANFAQLWINWHTAQAYWKANDPEKSYTYMTNVMQNYNLLDKPDRLKDYPEDLHKWFDDTKPEAEKFWKEVKAKTNRR
jgi:hypothetical protein